MSPVQPTGFFGDNHLHGAHAAQLGRGGNDLIEAMLPRVIQDDDGDLLDASTHHCPVTWAAGPPTETFRSLTMYDTSYDGAAGYVVQNPIDRYLISSTTEGIALGDDASLTLHPQHERPEDDAAEANW